jgi:hypothetical protein
MSAGRATYLPLTEQTFPSEHLSLLEAYQGRASWIWIAETSPYTAPNAPSGEQRGFRFTYTNNDPTRTPSNAIIVLAVDNYFALYINGAIVHEADPRNDLFTASAFSVPIQSPSNKTVFAVRAINGRSTPDQTLNPAGLITAVKINFQGSGGSEVFVSGTDTKWVGESLLAPGWEETNFDDGSWQTAIVYPSTVANTPWPPDRRLAPSTLAVAARLTSPQTTVTSSPDNQDSSGNLQPGAWAGIVVGAALLAAALAAVATFFLTRRRYQPMKRASLASSGHVAYTSVPPTIQTTPFTYPPNHAHQESLSTFAPASAPTEHHDYPPAYVGSNDGTGSVVSGSGGSSNQQPPGPRYQVHHASVHKSNMSTGGLTNR